MKLSNLLRDALKDLPAYQIRMNAAQECALEGEAITVSSNLSRLISDMPVYFTKELPPRTFGGVKVLTDTWVPPDEIWIEKVTGERIATLTNLAVPEGY